MLSSVFALSFAILFLTMDRGINAFDEGIVLTDAMRVAAGEVIHRDFYSIYGPGSYYLVAALFELFPLHFLAARAFGIAVMAATVAATTALMLDRARPFFTVLATTATLLLLFASPFYLYPLFPCLLLTCASALRLIEPGPIDSSRRLLIVGVWAGVAAWFRYDVGALMCVCSSIGVVALLAIERRGGHRFPGEAVRAVSLLALGAAAVFAPGAIAYLVQASSTGFQADVIDYGFRHYAAMRGLPFPGPSGILHEPALLLLYLPPFALAVGAIEIAHRHRARTAGRTTDPTVRAIAICAAFALGMFVKGWVRVSTVHMSIAIVPALVVLALCADALWSRGRAGMTALLVSLVALPVAMAAAGQARPHVADPSRSPLGWAAATAFHWGPLPGAPPSCPQRPAHWGARLGPAEAAIANYIRRVTPVDERILVALDRHDRVWINAVSLYFLAERLPATHWHQFDPGMQTRADIQANMIRELEAKRVRWIVRDGIFQVEPNDSRHSSGVHLLDDFLAANYRKVAVAGGRSVWLRNGVPAPAGLPTGRAACMPDAVHPEEPSATVSAAETGR